MLQVAPRKALHWGETCYTKEKHAAYFWTKKNAARRKALHWREKRCTRRNVTLKRRRCTEGENAAPIKTLHWGENPEQRYFQEQHAAPKKALHPWEKHYTKDKNAPPKKTFHWGEQCCTEEKTLHLRKNIRTIRNISQALPWGYLASCLEFQVQLYVEL